MHAQHPDELGIRAAASVNHRAARSRDELRRLFDLARMALKRRAVRSHLDCCRIDVFGYVRSDVLRYVHDHRTWTPGGGNVKRLFDRCREVFYPLHQEIVFHARTGDADAIDFLESIVADEVGRHLSREDDQWTRIHISSSDAGYAIGRPGARGYEDDAGFAGRARVTVGRVCRALFVAHEDMLDLVLLENFVVDVEHCTAGIPEHVLDTFVR